MQTARLSMCGMEDEVAFGCENRNLPREEIRKRVEEACRMMQLHKDWSTQTLSGGQKQRLITASTLAMGQKILVFDEPLANLDAEGAHMLLNLLKKLDKRRICRTFCGTQAGYGFALCGSGSLDGGWKD